MESLVGAKRGRGGQGEGPRERERECEPNVKEGRLPLKAEAHPAVPEDMPMQAPAQPQTKSPLKGEGPPDH